VVSHQLTGELIKLVEGVCPGRHRVLPGLSVRSL
jgi:hypothetical protein